MDPPVPASATVTTAEDTPVSFTLHATDIDSATLTFSIATFPSDGSLTGSGANLTYTPAFNANGTRSFTFRVSDGLLTATGTMILKTPRTAGTSPSSPPAARWSLAQPAVS